MSWGNNAIPTVAEVNKQTQGNKPMFRIPGLAVAFFALPMIIAADNVNAQQVLRLGGVIFGDHSSVRAINEVFVPRVQERTEGRYIVEVYSNAELGGNAEIVQQTRNGTVFGAFVSGAWIASFVPEIGASGLPFLFEDRESAFRAFDSPAADPIRESMESAGIVPLGFMELGFRHLTTSSKLVDSPEDLAGMRIRLQNNPVHIETFRLLGANPVQIDGGELFAALNQGVADGQENPFSVISMFRLDEARQRYLTETGHFYDILTFIGSRRVMDGMSEEDRNAILEVAAETTELQRRYAAEEEQQFKDALLDKGVEMKTLTPEQRDAFRQATLPLYDAVATDLGQEFVQSFIDASRAQ